MKIIFVRNGESNLKTNKLTIRGKWQARSSKEFLKDEDFDVIYSSPQIRALQTAHILNKGNEKPLIILKGLDDRQPLPLEKEEFGEEYKKNYFNYSYENENFQTCKDYLEQVFVALDQIVKEKKDNKTVLIVAHNATLIAINAYFNGISKTNQIAWTQTNGGAVIKFLV